MDSAGETLTNGSLLARLADRRTTAQPRTHASVDPAEAVALYARERVARGESTVAPKLWFAIMTDRHVRVSSMWKSPGWDGKPYANRGVNTPFVFGGYDIPERAER